MAVITMEIKHEAWTQANMGAITTALNTILINHALEPTTFNWNGPTTFSLEVSRVGMTYAQFQAFRTEIEAGVAAIAATVNYFNYSAS